MWLGIFSAVFALCCIIVITTIISCVQFQDMLVKYNKRNPEEYRVKVPFGIKETLKCMFKYRNFVEDRNIADCFCPVVKDFKD